MMVFWQQTSLLTLDKVFLCAWDIVHSFWGLTNTRQEQQCSILFRWSELYSVWRRSRPWPYAFILGFQVWFITLGYTRRPQKGITFTKLSHGTLTADGSKPPKISVTQLAPLLWQHKIHYHETQCIFQPVKSKFEQSLRSVIVPVHEYSLHRLSQIHFQLCFSASHCSANPSLLSINFLSLPFPPSWKIDNNTFTIRKKATLLLWDPREQRSNSAITCKAFF